MSPREETKEQAKTTLDAFPRRRVRKEDWVTNELANDTLHEMAIMRSQLFDEIDSFRTPHDRRPPPTCNCRRGGVQSTSAVHTNHAAPGRGNPVAVKALPSVMSTAI